MRFVKRFDRSLMMDGIVNHFTDHFVRPQIQPQLNDSSQGKFLITHVEPSIGMGWRMRWWFFFTAFNPLLYTLVMLLIFPMYVHSFRKLCKLCIKPIQQARLSCSLISLFILPHYFTSCFPHFVFVFIECTEAYIHIIAVENSRQHLHIIYAGLYKWSETHQELER